MGQFVVNTSGIIDMGPANTVQAPGWFEVGLPFRPAVQPVPVTIQGANIEGMPRKWDKIFCRVKETTNLAVNGENMIFAQSGDPSDEGPQPFTGDVNVTGQGWSLDAPLFFTQTAPGPFTLQGIFGTVNIGDKD